MRIGICDDEAAVVENHAAQTERVLRRLGIHADIVKCSSGEEVLMEIEEYGKFDVLLLDIEMEPLDGIETAQKIREEDYRAILIFVSADDSHCKRAIGVQPFAFLDKPLEEETLYQVFQKVVLTQLAEKKSYYFRSNGVCYQVDMKEIYYFSSNKRLIKLSMKDREYQFYGTLSGVERELRNGEETFLRIHKSWLVNTRYIKEYHYDKVVLENGEELAISKKNRNEIRNWYMELLKGKVEEWD